MGKGRRIAMIAGGVLLILCAILLLYLPDRGYIFVALILAVSIIVRGVGRIIYYFRMARNMVDSHMQLFTGILMVDVGLFILTLTDIPLIYVMFYLIGIHALSGGISVLRALEMRRMEDPSWRWQLAGGIISIVTALLCMIFIQSGSVAILVYSISLIITAINRIITAFRRTSIVYVA